MTDIIYGLEATRKRDPILMRWNRTVDHTIIAAVSFLYLIGLLLCYAASVPLAERLEVNPFDFVIKQAAYGIVAITLMLLISTLSAKSARRVGIALFLCALIGVLLLPVFGTDYGKGAIRWFSLGFGSIQPSEFLKPGFIVITAWLIAGSLQADGPPGKKISFALLMLMVLLLVGQPDFGQAVLVIFGWSVLYYASGGPLWPLVVLGGATGGGGFAAFSMSEHFRRRILEFLDGSDKGSQVANSIDAFREGGFFGVGPGQGTVKWTLPDAHTDFVVAVAAEEFGFSMVLVIVLLFVYICIASIRKAGRARDPFVRLASTGLVAMIGIQAVVHLAVAVGALPPKGLTLPFISYGGSSMLATGIAFGLLLAFGREAQEEKSSLSQ